MWTGRREGAARGGRLATAGLALLAAGTALAACSSSPSSSPGSTTVAAHAAGGPQQLASVTWTAPGPSTVPAFYDPPSPLPAAPPGTLIRYQVVRGVPGVPAGATLYRVLYHSRSVLGADVAVSGYVVLPAAAPPAGGYPVIAWAHGTTGVARICAPSLFSEAPDASGLYLMPGIADLLARGLAVAATDYEGLGGPGVHPYLVGQAEGQDVLDSVRAAAQLPGVHLSRDVVIVGHSQGGQAALFAAQLAAGYSPQLHVLGTVAIAPLTEVSTALPVAMALGSADLSLLASAAYAWAHTYPDLPMRSLFVSSAIPRIDRLESTECQSQVSDALKGSPLFSVLLPSLRTNPTMVRYLAANSPGAVHTGSPILVLQGTSDGTVPVFLNQTFESEQCPAVHDDLELRLYPGAGHTTVITAGFDDMESWIEARLAGEPVPAGCSSVTVSGAASGS